MMSIVDSIRNGSMDRIVIVLFALAAITITTLGDISILNYSLDTTLGSSDVPLLGVVEYTPAMVVSLLTLGYGAVADGFLIQKKYQKLPVYDLVATLVGAVVILTIPLSGAAADFFTVGDARTVASFAFAMYAGLSVFRHSYNKGTVLYYLQ